MPSPPYSILITGATSPIGRSVARRFAGRGWIVGILDPDGSAVDTLAAELSGAAHVFSRAVDPTDVGQVEQAISDFGEHTSGQLNVLVNAAGVMRSGRFEELPLETQIGRAHV